MDHNKINYDLIVAVLEWIVGNDHEVISLHCMCITLYVYYKNTKHFKILPVLTGFSHLIKKN